MAHSVVGASSCERWWNCPGSNALMASLPPAETSSYAAEGTAAHELAEQSLNLVLCSQTQEWPKGDGSLGETIEVEDFNIKVNSEMLDAVKLYVMTIIDDAKKLGLTLKNSNRINRDRLNIEKNFALDDVDPEAFGTNDCSIVQLYGKLIVYDFKYGKGIPIEAVENKQMLYYAIGAAGEDLEDFESIELVIIQPRASHPEGPIRRWKTTPEYVLNFKNKLKTRIRATREKDAMLSAGKWCKWCTAKLNCYAVKAQVVKTAQMDFNNTPTKNNPPAPESLTLKDLKNVLDNADLLEDWVKSVREYAYKYLEKGGKIKGYALGRSSNTRRKWIDEDKAQSMLELEFGEDKVFEVKLKSPAQIEKINKIAKSRVAELSFKPEGALVLTRESNIKEKQTTKAISDFQNVVINV